MVADPASKVDDLLRTAQRAALHLEMRDTYAGTDTDFSVWQAGLPFDPEQGHEEWHAVIRPLVERGVDVRRARIVSEPVSDYIRFEHEITRAASIVAGEQVRWVPRPRVSDLALPGNDFWLVDDRVLFNHFSGDGGWVGSEFTTEQSVVKLCASAFAAVWERGVDHADYRPT